MLRFSQSTKKHIANVKKQTFYLITSLKKLFGLAFAHLIRLESIFETFLKML